MMTKDEKLLIVALRLDGYTLREIAEEFTKRTNKKISFQYIAHTLNSLSTGESKNVCKYPAIWNWMIKNDMDTESFAECLGVTNATLKKVLRIAAPMTEKFAKKISCTTGISVSEIKETYAIYKKRKPIQDRYANIKYPAVLHYLETHRYPISKIATECGYPYYKVYSAITSLDTKASYDPVRESIAKVMNINEKILFSIDKKEAAE